MNINEPTHDDLVTFGRLMLDTVWHWSTEPVERVLEFFEFPHKYQVEMAKWVELGGTLEKAVCDEFARWYDNRDLPVDDEDE